jgi:hypothetical protein
MEDSCTHLNAHPAPHTKFPRNFGANFFLCFMDGFRRCNSVGDLPKLAIAHQLDFRPGLTRQRHWSLTNPNHSAGSYGRPVSLFKICVWLPHPNQWLTLERGNESCLQEARVRSPKFWILNCGLTRPRSNRLHSIINLYLMYFK